MRSIEFGPVKQLNPDNACAGDKNKGAVPQEEPCMPPEQDQYLPIASDLITGGGGSSSSMNGMPLCDHCGHYK
ncbi:hypothetical protein HID58_081522 [Brassica napus]|uniref:Uncharacterized protein n=1 Tax=Brassica napus TaxID=3708 RepID=A0ABQ7YAU6_BRANA|nr:hypothetical protein HID58_081522 [Brassica napus]